MMDKITLFHLFSVTVNTPFCWTFVFSKYMFIGINQEFRNLPSR